jgi:hypothetical protein
MATIDPKLILETIEKNVARQNRFSFLLQLPSIQNVSVDQTTLQYYCKAINFPSQTATPIEAKYLGVIKYAIVTQDIDTVNMTFWDTKQLVIRTMFKNWLESITSHNKYEVLQYYPNQYQTSGTLTIEEKEYNFLGITPTTVGDWVLDMENDNQLGTFSVTFKIKKVE